MSFRLRIATFLFCVALVPCILGYKKSSNLFLNPVASSKKPMGTSKLSVKMISPRYQYGISGFQKLVWSDEKTIWSIGYDGKNAQKILFSKNKGLTWMARIVPSEGWLFNDIFFLDGDNGWVAGANGQIFFTRDGGQTWIPTISPNKLPISKIFFITKKIGFLVSSKENFNKESQSYSFGIQIYRTMTGGDSWQLYYEDDVTKSTSDFISLSPDKVLLSLDYKGLIEVSSTDFNYQNNVTFGSERVVDIGRFNQFSIWKLSPQKGLYRSDDEGFSWIPFSQNFFLSQDAWKIASFSDNFGLLLSRDGTIVFSVDGGISWETFKFDLVGSPYSIIQKDGEAFLLTDKCLYLIEIN